MLFTLCFSHYAFQTMHFKQGLSNYFFTVHITLFIPNWISHYSFQTEFQTMYFTKRYWHYTTHSIHFTVWLSSRYREEDRCTEGIFLMLQVKGINNFWRNFPTEILTFVSFILYLLPYDDFFSKRWIDNFEETKKHFDKLLHAYPGHSCLARPNKLPRKYFIRYNFAKSGKEEAVVTGME